jgi:hypothetical protein
LAEVWASALAQRRELLSALRTELDPRGERMSVMSTANWVRSGRTPREHQVRYDRFVGVATNVFDEGELSMRGGTGRYVNDDPLPDWLDLIAAGTSVASASQRIVDREYEQASRQTADGPDLSHRIRELWRTVTNRWQDLLAGMALGHHGRVFALFHMFGSTLNHDLMDVCLTYGPAAQLSAGHLDWIAATVPASFRPHLATREHGLAGLVLLDQSSARIDSDRCALFLRNLVIDLGHPELGQHVVPCGEGEPDLVDDTRESFVDVTLPDHLHGFAGPAGYGRGVTTADCVPALRAALQGQTLTRPRARTTRRR